MNNKRSYFKLLTASAAVGLFLANCTVKNSSDDSCEKGDKDLGCDCPGGLTGYQLCDSDGVFGSCVCPDDNSGAGTSNSSTAGKSNSSTGGTSSNQGGEPASNGGKTYTAGTDAGGVAAVNGGAGGEGGAGLPDFMEDCNACLDTLCKTELDACLNDPQCFSAEGDGSGEYEAISTCIETARASGLVKRDAVRSCGVTFGASSDPEDPSNFSDWAPRDMAATTTDLLNCMATSSSQTPDAQWANDPNNFPAAGPTPWPADSCAKLACTSGK
jgi:hypothetical protein